MRDTTNRRRFSFSTSKRGIGLIEVALFIMTLGLVIIVAIKMVDHRIQRQKVEVTAQHVDMVEEAVKKFKAKNLRLPGPAPMNAAPDSARYGKEITLPGGVGDATTAGATAGTNVVAGRDPDGAGALPAGLVRTGTIPVRSLDLPDEVMLDGWGNRLIYAVTQQYMFRPTNPADEATNPFNYDLGAISMVDSGGNSSSSTMGNVIYTVVAHGSDSRGAYSAQGVIEGACDNTNATIGENCFSDNDARFSNSMSMKGDTATTFAYKVKYDSSYNLYEWYTDNPTWDLAIDACNANTGYPCNQCKQDRLVECHKAHNIVVADAFCLPPFGAPKIADFRILTPSTVPSVPLCTWQIGGWSGCSSSCGSGSQSRSVTCFAPASIIPGSGSGQPDAPCMVNSGKPPTSQGCCTPCCGSPPGCGGTYSGACGESCSEPACPPPPPPSGSSSSSSSSSGGSGTSSGGGCTCGPDPGCDTGPYADSCGDPNGCNAPSCPCTCGAAACDSGSYPDSCGNPSGCTAGTCPPITPPSSGCSGNYTYMNCFNWGCTAGGSLAWYDAICCVQCDGNFIPDNSTPGYSQLVTHNTSLCGSPELQGGWDQTYAAQSCCVTQYDGTLACSDKRLKKNITPIPAGTLDKVLSLKPVTFDWKSSSMGSGKQIGLIAQDVEKVYPEMVEDGADGIKRVHYQFLGPLLVKALAETNAKIKLLVAINILLVLGLLLAVFIRRKK